MGIPQGDDLVQVTNPYYRTTYALVFKPGTGLDGVDTLADARLKDKRIGIVAGTPPATNMAVNGLMSKAKPYPLVIDTRFDSSGCRDDAGSGEGRDRRGRALGADGRLLRQASRHAVDARSADQGEGRATGSPIASAWACGFPIRTGNASSIASFTTTSRRSTAAAELRRAVARRSGSAHHPGCSDEVKRLSLLAAAVAFAILGLRCAAADEVAPART